MTSATAAERGRNRRPTGGLLLVGLTLLGLLTGSAGTATAVGPRGGLTASPRALAAQATVPRPDHVVVVMMENENRAGVLGSSAAPYLNALAQRGANMSRSYGVTHPSQGNYVALFSGDQHGVTDDACPQNLGAKPNLGRQLQDAGLSFTGYAESLPRPGWTGCASGRYKRKHNPWVNFSNVGADANQPFTAFPSNYNRLPTVSFVSPNMCNDMHDCPVRTGDRWLQTKIDRYARWAMTHNSLLVVTFDENDGGSVNPIPTLLVGQHVRPGHSAERMNHYTLLRTLEDAYGLAPLGHARNATALSTIWTSPRPAGGVRNGTFESKLTGWTTSGSTYSSKNSRHSGSRSARAGSTKATRGDSVLSQTLTVPAGRTRLNVWWRGRCSDTVSKAWATVLVRRGPSGRQSTLLPRSCLRNGGWRKVSVPVSPGSSYTLRLVNHDDGKAGTPNRTYFDDVTLS